MNPDILETYTARGLLGTVIVRRLASRAQPLPEAVPDVFAELIRCALIRCADRGQVSESGSLDLDVQDELAPAAEMLRVVESSSRTRILDAIRARDPDAAVAA